jgi:hypothetical protein
MERESEVKNESGTGKNAFESAYARPTLSRCSEVRSG